MIELLNYLVDLVNEVFGAIFLEIFFLSNFFFQFHLISSDFILVQLLFFWIRFRMLLLLGKHLNKLMRYQTKYEILLPIPSAGSKYTFTTFNFLILVKSKILPIYIFEHGLKYLNTLN